MLSRQKESDIQSEDPFAGDEFERKVLGEGLVNLLARIQGPLTIAVTGPYGSGKTHFLSRCKVMLQKQGVPVVLLNAWESDFAAEPLAPLVSELTAGFSKSLAGSGKVVRNIKMLAAKVAAAALPLAVKVATAGLLNADDFTEGALADAAQRLAEEQFQRYAAAKASIESLREELTALSEKIRPKAEPRPPVVVIVDELDRCRPTYAVDLLEIVKHLFNVPGIVFVLGVDRGQLGSSASAVFGDGLDTDGYLRRFIDLECALPEPNLPRYCGNNAVRIIRETAGVKVDGVDIVVWLAIGELCKGAKFSIRRTNQLLTRIGIGMTASNNFDAAETIALLTFLRDWNATLFGRFVKRQATAWEVFEQLRRVSPNAMEYNSNWRQEPFIWMFATVGMDDPEPFATSYRNWLTANGKPTANIDRIESTGVGRWPRFLEEMARFVDFGASFIAR